MTFEQFYRIVLSRRKLALSLFLGILALAIVLSLLLPKSYEAKASIMVDLKPDPISGLAQMATMQPSSYLSTQVNIIKSDAVARRVVDMLRLGEAESMRAKWARETQERGSYQDWLGKVLLKGLSVSAVRESSIIQIEYEAVDPAFAAALANAFAKAYIDTLVQLRTDPAKRYTDYFEERARLAREKLERAQERLAQVQRERGILMTDERMDTEIARLNELGSQLVSIRAMLSDSANRRIVAKRQADESQEVLASPVVVSMKTELARLNALLKDQLSQKGDSHPQVVQTRASIAELERRMSSEMARVTGSVGNSESIMRAREAAARKAYDEQRERIMKMKNERSDVSVLEKEVESAQRVYEAIQLRLSQSNLESNSSQATAHVLSPAVEPPRHSSPSLLLNLAIAIFGGSVLTLFVTLAAELLDRRVRTAVDLVQALELPVIGAMPSPLPPKRFWLRRKTPQRLVSPA